jgi:hypothetical protein
LRAGLLELPSYIEWAGYLPKRRWERSAPGQATRTVRRYAPGRSVIFRSPHKAVSMPRAITLSTHNKSMR